MRTTAVKGAQFIRLRRHKKGAHNCKQLQALDSLFERFSTGKRAKGTSPYLFIMEGQDMTLERHEYQWYMEFVKEHRGETLEENAQKALAHYMTEGNLDAYVIIRVKGYYAVARVVDEWNPIEICTEVQPFDSGRVYPRQRVQKEIDWVY